MVHKFNCIAPFLSNSLLIKYFKREGRLSKHFTAIMLLYNHVNRFQIPRDNFSRRNHSDFLLLLWTDVLGIAPLSPCWGCIFKRGVCVCFADHYKNSGGNASPLSSGELRFMGCICVLKHIKTCIKISAFPKLKIIS